jgi:hypothetical protein
MSRKTYFDPSDPFAEQTHWTMKGVFMAIRASRIGVPGWELWLDEKFLDWDTCAGSLVRRLKSGEFNDKLGFDGREITLDEDPRMWNRHR